MKHVTPIRFIIGLALFLVLMALLSSCEILKRKESRKLDTRVETRDSTASEKESTGGTVSDKTTDKVTEWDWWRYIQIPQRDTSVVNNYITSPQPVVIVEGGKGREEVAVHQSDSSWYYTMERMFNERMTKLEQLYEEQLKDKRSETKGLGLFAVLGIGLGLVVLNKLLSRVNISLKK
jgi:hypothetical protein